MSLFLGNYTNKVDRKGRVSLPAAFRDALEGQTRKSVVLFPSIRTPDAIEGWRYDSLAELNRALGTLNLFSDELDAFASAIFAHAVEASVDNDGRILLAPELRASAGIELDDGAAFVGAGTWFLIWQPARFEAQKAEMMEKARAQLRRGASISLSGRRGANDTGGGA
jgi:MraZ protein